jgi:carbamoyl-phosphate synthase large subunit
MPKRTDIHSILIIGSGPIVIGQACEFDYSGTQACRVLREEGYRVILVNSNPATIMTDPDFADATYVEPITWEVVARIIERERPDAVLPTMGGQTGLNTAMALFERGIIGVPGTPEMIGANAEAIATAEDREKFKQAMIEIGLSVPSSGTAHTIDEARTVVAEIGLPCIIRPAYILGGRGTGIASTLDEFERVAANGLQASPISEILIEKSIAGWKEYELEVMRDRADNCVIICSIENVDPMGVHTGDSITVAPAQTLSDVEYQQMRDPPRRCRDRWQQRAVRREPGRRRAGGHRDEPARVAQLGARVEGNRLPDREDRGEARRRLHPRRDPERHHQDDPGQFRAQHRLRRHQGAALGIRETARYHRCARHPDAVGR